MSIFNKYIKYFIIKEKRENTVGIIKLNIQR